jgi:hypothetical protein
MFHAKMHTRRHYYEAGEETMPESILDTDADIDVLRDRVNAYFAQPKVIDFYRSRQFVIKPGEKESNTTYAEGGGCGATHWITLEEARWLKVGA